MIRTHLAYDDSEIYINPYTISYVIRQDYRAIIGLTNGHTFDVKASINEILEGVNNETKSLCKECKECARKQNDNC